ncbi:hypothetical protein H8Z72_22665 (plasmid) [Xanthomonas citri pv. citri]|uniref:hypothetical protein n=1 Tax=Xanthomonas citri TaxID=346 RepID=UPI0019345144|nr:hypothetical protein [Xanthomonas citri]QRD62667.1 hypothetical protein H8Z74_23520 [Xanthomonas citri pv. citri]QRD67202.1 hypothetical protein H8Z73_22500 [Xanthomonas citri pv. citri]QRD71753.1 hypothetical protein H8Z72_22665 [Xanthomonas citri pv. citri]
MNNSTNTSQQEVEPAVKSNGVQLRLTEFNYVRALRGAPAARFDICDAEGETWLWMSQSDIAKNIAIFGQDPELLKARAAYRSLSRRPVRTRK